MIVAMVGHTGAHWVCKVGSRQWTVSGHNDVVLRAPLSKLELRKTRVKLDLVDHRHDFGHTDELFQVPAVPVATRCRYVRPQWFTVSSTIVAKPDAVV